MIGRAVAVLGRNIIPFGGLALAVTGLVMLVRLPWLGSGTASGGLLYTVLDLLATQLLTAALIYGTVQELRGRHAGMVDAVVRGVRALWPVFLLAILILLGTVLGLVFFIVPGLILMTLWWVAIPVAVIERTGVLAALGRSANLTAGHRWPILAIILILFGAQLALSLLADVVGALGGVPVAGLAAQWLASAAVTALRATVSAVGYNDLRVVKEGAEIEDIAAVFD